MIVSLITRRSLHSAKVRNSSSLELKTVLKGLIPQRKQEILELKKNYSDVKVGDITVGSVLGGMRGNNSMFWQSTFLDPYKGIRFQGKTIQDCQKLLPKDPKDPDKKGNFLPEAMFWLLVTGQVPTQEQTVHLSRELGMRGRNLPDYTEKTNV